MPRDASPSSSSSSSSSSEDEGPGPETHAELHLADSESTRSTRTSQNTKFQCPADFVSFSYKPCSSTPSAHSSSELWLIKAPASFEPQCFTGVQLPLHGMSSLSVPSTDGGELTYTVLSSSRRCSEFRLLTFRKDTPSITSLGPPFTGLISINQSYGSSADCDQALHTIPALPPPALPPGLKHRFQYTAVSVGKKRRREKRFKTEEPSESTVREEATHCSVKTEVKVELLEPEYTQTQQDHRSSKKKSRSNKAK